MEFGNRYLKYLKLLTACRQIVLRVGRESGGTSFETGTLVYQLGKIPFSHPAELPERDLHNARDLHNPQSEKEAVVWNVSQKIHRGV